MNIRRLEASNILTLEVNIKLNTSVAIYGVGETGKEFYGFIKKKRPDLSIVNFIDSYKIGEYDGVKIISIDEINTLSQSVIIIICSVYWDEILLNIPSDFDFMILSNELINESSHLKSFGSFYFEEQNEKNKFIQNANMLKNKLNNILDREIFENIISLRTTKNELDFFSYFEKTYKDNFKNKIKYADFLNLENINDAIEGGVFDGEDSYFLIKHLLKSINFRKLYSFDPFLEPFYDGEYIKKIGNDNFLAVESILWHSNEKVYLRIDKENPANSKILQIDDPNVKSTDLIKEATTIDEFAKENQLKIDLIKLDVEGCELAALKGASITISIFKPKLAISVYHKKEDLVEIPEFLLSLNPRYKFSLSINNPSFIDVVLYAE
jgi:FkbM family methyltransferase